MTNLFMDDALPGFRVVHSWATRGGPRLRNVEATLRDLGLIAGAVTFRSLDGANSFPGRGGSISLYGPDEHRIGRNHDV